MSVPKSLHAQAEPEFLHTARELELFTIRTCVNKLPKRYTFYIGQPISQIAVSIYSNCVDGNRINPTNAHEVQTRRDYFLQAYVACESLVSQIEVVGELCEMSYESVQNWSAYIDQEEKLIKGVLKKDRERYRNIK